jgi:NADPH:quinone reductase-like Zn-dependent oxidoreductase
MAILLFDHSKAAGTQGTKGQSSFCTNGGFCLPPQKLRVCLTPTQQLLPKRTNNMASRVILITGCSTGVGLATATLLARSGHVVYASMRNLAKKDELQKAAAEAGALPENLHFTQLDVTNDESVASAIGTTP